MNAHIAIERIAFENDVIGTAIWKINWTLCCVIEEQSLLELMVIKIVPELDGVI